MFEQRIGGADDRASRRPETCSIAAVARMIDQAQSTTAPGACAPEEAERLRAALHARRASCGGLSPRELSTELGAWVDATVRAEFEPLVARFEREIADELTGSSGATPSASSTSSAEVRDDRPRRLRRACR